MPLRSSRLPRLVPLAALAALAAGPVAAQEASQATATLTATDGTELGTVTLDATESGVVLARISLDGLPDGTHGIHLHETGDCSAADFTSAGGHIAGDAAHGIYDAAGPHPGDMPNIHPDQSGAVEAEAFLTGLDMDGMVLDDDGAAVVVHAGADDYATQPSGESGARIACGVLEAGG